MSNDFNIEEQAQWLNSLAVKPFDSKGVMLASKIAREVRKRSGEIVSLSSKKAVAELGRAVLAIDDRDLNYLFRILLDSVTNEEGEDNSDTPGKKRLRGQRGIDQNSDAIV